MGTKILSAAIRDEYCYGCEKLKDCPTRQDKNELDKVNYRRLNCTKYHTCHSLFEVVKVSGDKPADHASDNKRDRREHGESGVQY